MLKSMREYHHLSSIYAKYMIEDMFNEIADGSTVSIGRNWKIER